MTLAPVNIAIWAIFAAVTVTIMVRPLRLPEAVWAVGGAVLLVAARLMPASAALDAVAKGLDVYLFLAGMMILSEIARREGLFDWIAALAVNHADGSPKRLSTDLWRGCRGHDRHVERRHGRRPHPGGVRCRS